MTCPLEAPATLCACGLDKADYHGQCPYCEMPEYGRVCRTCLAELSPDAYEPDEDLCDNCTQSWFGLRVVRRI